MKIPCERPTCKKSFEPAQNKRYCSDRCRVLHHYERTDEASRRLWRSIEPLIVSPEIDVLPEPERLQNLISGNAPSQAVGYRVGCPNRFTSEELQYLRWFPSRDREPSGLFAIHPFQRAMVPSVGIYAVAYFAEDLKMLGGPRFKIQINWAQRIIKWSHGDRKLPLSDEERR